MKFLVVWLTLLFMIAGLAGLVGARAQTPKPRLSCEEITGGLYIANAQLAEQLRDTAQRLQETQAELEKLKATK